MKPFYLLIFILLGLNTCLSAQKLPPSIEWKKCFGGTGDDRALNIIKAIDGGFIIVGSTRSNNGDLTAHHGSTDSTDAWVVKISATGEKEWQRNYGGTGNDMFKSIVAVTDGNYICFGTTTSNNNGDVSGSRGYADIWVVKIDRYGNILWQRALGGGSTEEAGNLRQFNDGNLYLVGTTWSNNGDVTGLKGMSDVWVVKLDLGGNLLSQKIYGSLNEREKGVDISESDSGRFYLAVTTDWGDGDFAGAVGNPPMSITAKVDPVTGVISQTWTTRATALSVTATENGGRTIVNERLYCAPLPNPGIEVQGAFRGFGFYHCLGYLNGDFGGYYAQGPDNYAKWNAVDHINVGGFDTSELVSSPHGLTDGFIGSYASRTYNDTARLNWRMFVGGSSYDLFTSVRVISETEFIVVGYTMSNDQDVSGNHGNYDMWVVKLGKTNLIKGSVFIDRNSNGTKESDEPAVYHMLVESKKTGSTFASDVSAGVFTNTVDTGSYVTKPIVNLPYYTAIPVTHNSSFATYNNSDSVVFAIQPIPNKKDYRLTMYSQDFARPGFETRYVITYDNIGTDTLLNKTVTFVKDSRQTLTFTSLPETSISGDTIRWTLNNVLPGQGGWFGFVLTNATPPDLENGDTLTVSALLDSTGDLNTADNYASLQHIVTGSFDPNDKLEAHAGSITKDELDNSKPLIYTIRFQNTGTDTAFNIVIRDTLDAKLDWTSLEMINASHPYNLTVKDGNKLTWTLANILLVDSNRNEPASHGYVTYRIKVKPGYVIDDTVRNTAFIYFDFNLPVVTNTTETVVKPIAPPTPVVTGLQTSYCGLVGVQTAKITNLPANGSGTSVSVKIDGVTVPVGADSTFSFNVSTLTAGSHSILVQFSNSSANRVSTSDFTIADAVNPDVNLAANITTITNLATPVIITATNATGGGTGPLYTFAKDRSFTNMWQAESVNNTWTFDPSILDIGDNMIYVRMKSNASCVVANTAIDSVLLKRSSVTGINDPDMPGQVIDIYPNPFRDVIMIKGLSAAKTYTVTLYNLEGKQIVSRRVSNRSTLNITRQHQATGAYWLSIYDEKRKQLLGTVKLLKQ